MQQILLIDVDSKIPNLALMKISGYYKARDYDVTLWRLGYSGYVSGAKKRRYINAKSFEMVFVSCIFSCNKAVITVDSCDKSFFGGTGYDIKTTLPIKIDQHAPDYSIYPDNDFSYGFITRGCVRKCAFCVVPEKEGKTYKNRDIDQIVRHKKTRFLDNNILSFPGRNEILQELIDKKIRCTFYQGLDIRLIDDEVAALLSKLKYINEYVFAFDDISLMSLMDQKVEILKKYIQRDWSLMFFIYCNAKMNIKKDIMPRVLWCIKNKFRPYIMRDQDLATSKHKVFMSELARWCCQPGLIKHLSFNEYLLKRPIASSRRIELNKIYKDVTI